MQRRILRGHGARYCAQQPEPVPNAPRHMAAEGEPFFLVAFHQWQNQPQIRIMSAKFEDALYQLMNMGRLHSHACNRVCGAISLPNVFS